MDGHIIEQDHEHCIAVWNRTVIHIWQGAPTIRTVTRMVEVCESLITDGNSDVTCVGIIERSSPAPDEPARRALARWSKDVVPRMARAAFIADGGGFRAALVRGVGVALTTVMPHKVPFKFFATVDEALPYFAPKLAPGQSSAQLRAVIEQLRAGLARQAAAG